ncbi:MAG TPA: hypothetical protein VN961_22680, partial [Streptosporangiaceae bacterium]|nr:hypothetical protein [Streptosporangiaceae bacterium]
PAILAALRQVGHARPWARDAACVPPAGDGAAIPWTLPLDGNDIRRLACYLHTACLITTAMVTGMRGCEKRAELHQMQHSSRMDTSEPAGHADVSEQLAARSTNLPVPLALARL